MRHLLWALGALVVLGLAMLLAVNWWVSAAYYFADGYPLASVTGRNDLWKLGTASRVFTAAGLLLVALIAFIATVVLVIGRRTRRFAWLAPLAAIVLVAAVTAIGIAMFEPPPPDVGG